MTYVLGIDPGGTTGICLLEVPEDRPTEVRWMQELGGGAEAFIDWYAGTEDYWHVVCESFALDGRTPKPDLTPVEIIGALKALHPWDRLHFQTNTQGKHLMTNEVLKRAGYYPKRGDVKGGHAVDALRHALTYVVKQQKHLPTMNKLFPKPPVIEGTNAVE